VRTPSALTLVVLPDDPAATAEVTHAAVRAVAGHGPGRVLGRVVVVTRHPGGAACTNASITVRSVERAGCPPADVDQVSLEVHGHAGDDLGDVVAPWVLAGRPLAVWVPRRPPQPGEPLVAEAARSVEAALTTPPGHDATWERALADSRRLLAGR
jgi:hypothetical protein